MYKYIGKYYIAQKSEKPLSVQACRVKQLRLFPVRFFLVFLNLVAFAFHHFHAPHTLIITENNYNYSYSPKFIKKNC